MRYEYKNPEGCPVTELMSVMGGRWKFIILYTIRNSPRRFGQINQLIPSISNKVLTEQLRELEEDNIISRTVISDKIPINVEYNLTEEGRTLLPVIEAIASWGSEKAKRHG